MSGLTNTAGDCTLIGDEISMSWINLIGYVGPYTDGDDHCGVYFQVSDNIPDRTQLNFMLHDW